MMTTLVLLLLLAPCVQVEGFPTLTSNETAVISGGNLTLTCALPYPTFGIVFMENTTGAECRLDRKYCSIKEPCFKNLYTCSENESSFSLTLIYVSDVMNGWTFVCYDPLIKANKSNAVRILIQVPVTSVTLIPLGIFLSVETGKSINLTCTTGESRPQSNITWHRNNSIIAGTTLTVTDHGNNTFITTSVLMVSGNKSLHRDQIYCSASNLADRIPVKSEIKTINILFPVTSVTLIPLGIFLSVETGKSINLTCTTGESRPQSNITWHRNNSIIAGTTLTVTDHGNNTFITTSMLMVSGNKSLHRDQIYCSASNLADRIPVKSEIKTINILYPPVGQPVLSVLALQYKEGEEAKLKCNLSEDGNPVATWIWTCEGRTIQNKQISNSPGQSVLTLITNRTDDRKRCSCHASSNIGPYNQTSQAVTLSILHAATITMDPLPHRVLENDTVSVTCYLDGNPAPVLVWRNDDKNIVLKRDDSDSQKRQFLIPHSHCLDTGTYGVEASNGYGTKDIKMFNLSVFCRPRPDERVNIDTNIPLNEEREMILSLPYIGNPSPTVTWYFRKGITNENIMNGGNVIITLRSKGKVEFTSLLVKTHLTPDDMGHYVAVLNNSEGFSNITFNVFTKESDTAIATSSEFSTGTFFGGIACALAIVGIVFFVIFVRRKTTIKTKGKRQTSNSLYEDTSKDMQDSHTYSDLNMSEPENTKGAAIYMNTALQECGN